ncbi:hypothetical protein D9M68_763570 [compost metagenome]
MFGVVHRPVAHRALPDAHVELAAGAGVVVAYALLGIALENLLGRRAVVLRGGGGLGEVDDLLDVHFVVPVQAALRMESASVPTKMSICLLAASVISRRPSVQVKYIPSALSSRRGDALSWRLAVKDVQKSSRLLDILPSFGVKAFVIVGTGEGEVACSNDLNAVYV